MSEALTSMLRSVALFVPKALAFLAIVVIGFIVARLLRRLVDKVLERVGFDRWVERGGIKSALARSRYDASDIVAKLAYYAVLLFTLQLAFGIWGPNPVSDLIEAVVAWLPRAFVAIVIVVVAAAIASAVKDLIGNALSGLSYGRLLANVAAVFILGVGVIAALNQIGVATTVTTPILITVLATIGGILVVGVGGGLIRPMQARWDRWLDRAESESKVIAEQARAYQAGQQAAAQHLAQPGPADVGTPAAAYPLTATQSTPSTPTADAMADATARPAAAPAVEPEMATQPLPHAVAPGTDRPAGNNDQTVVIPRTPPRPPQ